MSIKSILLTDSAIWKFYRAIEEQGSAKLIYFRRYTDPAHPEWPVLIEYTIWGKVLPTYGWEKYPIVELSMRDNKTGLIETRQSILVDDTMQITIDKMGALLEERAVRENKLHVERPLFPATDTIDSFCSELFACGRAQMSHRNYLIYARTIPGIKHLTIEVNAKNYRTLTIVSKDLQLDDWQSSRRAMTACLYDLLSREGVDV